MIVSLLVGAGVATASSALVRMAIEAGAERLGIGPWRRRATVGGQAPLTDGPDAVAEPPAPGRWSSLTDRRAAALAELGQSLSDDAVEVEVERAFVCDLGVAGGALVTVGAGALVHPAIAVVGAPFVFSIATGFVGDAWREWRNGGRFGILALEAVAITGAVVTGHWLAASVNATFVMVARHIAGMTRDRSDGKIMGLFDTDGRSVRVRRGDAWVETPFDAVEVGDVVLVEAGALVPIDGVVTEGLAQVDQQALTGEADPVLRTLDDRVLAATMVLEGRIAVRTERAGADTAAMQIVNVLESTDDVTRQARSMGERIVERWAWPTIGLGAVAVPFAGPTAGLAVLFSGFGYTMRHAAPLSVLNHLQIAADMGVLIKDGRALELLAGVDTVVFDKTGTLTDAVPQVTAVKPAAGWHADEVLLWAASAEQHQSHPIAEGIRRAAADRALTVPAIDEGAVRLGMGLVMWIEGRRVIVGSARLLATEGVALDAAEPTPDGITRIHVCVDGEVAGVIDLRATVRPEVRPIIDHLRAAGIEVLILSGDREETTARLAEQLGVDGYRAGVLPDQKAETITALREEGRRVCFVGDGINDTIALRAADVSVSMHGATAAATHTASIILMDGDLTRLLPLFALADGLIDNLEAGTRWTMVPGAICIVGALVFHLGVTGASVLYNVGLIGSMLNSAWPALNPPLLANPPRTPDSPLVDGTPALADADELNAPTPANAPDHLGAEP